MIGQSPGEGFFQVAAATAYLRRDCSASPLGADFTVALAGSGECLEWFKTGKAQAEQMFPGMSKLSEAWTTIHDARHPSDPEKVQLNDPDGYRLLVLHEKAPSIDRLTLVVGDRADNRPSPRRCKNEGNECRSGLLPSQTG